jgi:hypothetical protein
MDLLVVIVLRRGTPRDIDHRRKDGYTAVLHLATPERLALNAMLVSIPSLLCSESQSRCTVCDYLPSHRLFSLGSLELSSLVRRGQP